MIEIFKKPSKIMLMIGVKLMSLLKKLKSNTEISAKNTHQPTLENKMVK